MYVVYVCVGASQYIEDAQTVSFQYEKSRRI